MDLEQLKQDFLEEIAGPIDLFLQENRRRMANTMSAKAYNKVGLLTQVLAEIERVILYYKASKLPAEYINKVAGIIKPITSIGRNIELTEIEKILVGIVKQLNQERGMKSNNLLHDEDDTEALRDDLWTAFQSYPTSDYESLKKAMMGEIPPKEKFMVKNKVTSAMKQDYDEYKDPAFSEFVIMKLQHIFNVLWDDEFEALAVKDLQDEREIEIKKLGGVTESVRAAILKNLMS